MSSRRANLGKFIIFIIGVFLLFGLVVTIGYRVFSYETDKTHPGLVALAARIYNSQTSGHSLTEREISWLQSGTIAEDTPNRWLNHFFDPIHNQGLKGRYLTAKDWAIDSKAQTKYALGDKSWQRALADYDQGDTESAFKALGHVLHLLADVSVPAHARDDIHIIGDSYEQFVGNNWLALSKNLFYAIIQADDLPSAFIELAYYANTNFFSDDTIVSKKYQMPQLSASSFSSGYFTRNLAGRTSKLLQARQSILADDFHIYRLDQAVLSDYVSYLLPKAVGYTAGVIDLFFRQANNSGQNYDLAQDRIGWQGHLDQLSGAVVSGLDDVYNTIKTNVIDQNDDQRLTDDDNLAQVETATTTEQIIPGENQILSANDLQTSSTDLAMIGSSSSDFFLPAQIASSFVYSSGYSQPIDLPQIILAEPVEEQNNPDSSTIMVIASSAPTSSISFPTNTFDLFLPVVFTSSSLAMSTDTTSNMVSSTLTAEYVTSSAIGQQMRRSVVINEIAWAGTHQEYSNDEWLELYNNTSSSVDISEWKIFIDNKELKIVSYSNKIIQPLGYYLLERSDDDTVKQIMADAIFSGGLKNSGAKIELFNAAGEKVDQVDCLAGWFAGDDVKYRSMERVDSWQSGDSSDNWQSNQGIREDGRSYNGAPIHGSPKRANFGFLALNYRQQEDLVTLTKANNPYILQYYEIPAGKTLRIEPGVMVKSYYNNSFIDVYGRLEIVGTSTNKVIFTSGRDKSFNNAWLDTMAGNWDKAEPHAGDWQGFWFHNSSSAHLVGFDMRYAGANFRTANYLPAVTSQSIRAEGAVIKIGDSEFNKHGGEILYLDNSSTTIANSSFSEGDIAIKTRYGNLVLSKLEFDEMNNEAGPIQIEGNWPEFDDLEFSGHTKKSIAFGQVEIKNKQVDLKSDLTYIFSSLIVDSSSTLNIEPGTVIELPTYGTMTINGQMAAVGTADQPIYLGKNIGWGYLMFNNSNSILKHVEINGGGGLPAEQDGAIIIRDSDLSVSSARIWNSRAPGNSIKSINSILTVKDSAIGLDSRWPDPIWAGQSYTTGIRMTGGELSLDDVYFTNLNYGVFRAKYNDQEPVITIDNMSASNYINVYRQSVW